MDDNTSRERKTELRRQFRRVRAELSPSDRTVIDAAICERLSSTAEYQAARVVLCYVSFGAEVDTRPLIERAWADGKVVAAPRCVPGTRDMEWYRITSFDGLLRSAFGVQEPDPHTMPQLDADVAPSLVVVPGLTFDASGFRLGYGGGFYDVFLSTFHGAAVGLCREAQLSASLPDAGVIDAHDRRVDAVVTESRVLRH